MNVYFLNKSQYTHEHTYVHPSCCTAPLVSFWPRLNFGCCATGVTHLVIYSYHFNTILYKYMYLVPSNNVLMLMNT